MAVFAIYTYKFREVENVGIFLGQEDDTKPLLTLQERQDFLQSIFRDHLEGRREFECFCKEESKDSQTGKKIRNKVPYNVKVLWESDGLILLMISNPYKTITRHEQFKKLKGTDDPWCHVFIDNRYGKEYIAIKNNGAFSSPDKVAEILEYSLRDRFVTHKVTIDIKNQYEPDAFWDIVNKNKIHGIDEVEFRFAEPNNPWAGDLIGSFNEAARSMKAKPTAIFSSSEGRTLILDKSNEELNNYIEACAMEGEDIIIKVKGIRSRIHVKKVTNKFVFKQMSDDVFKQILKSEPELFDKNFSELEEFLNQIKTSKEKQKELEK